jgi:peptide/nickel transport system permease protein
MSSEAITTGVGDAGVAVESGKSSSPTRQVLERTFRQKSAVIGLVVLILIIVVELLGYRLAPHDISHIDLSGATPYDSGPSASHPFGTDDFGRDILSRMMVGGRISLVVGFVAAFATLVVGTLVGGVSGFVGGFVDTVLMMITSWFLAFPFLLLALAIVAVRGPGLSTVILALVLSGWAYTARLLRGQILSIRETEYVEAARASGAGPLRIFFRHILPNSMAPVLVVTTLSVGGSIAGEASLSYLGVGIPPTDAISWGNMVGSGQNAFTFNPVEVLAPSGAIAVTLIAVTLFGNALRDAADPKLKD